MEGRNTFKNEFSERMHADPEEKQSIGKPRQNPLKAVQINKSNIKEVAVIVAALLMVLSPIHIVIIKLSILFH